MGFGSFLANFATGGLVSLFKKDNKPKADPFAALMQPLIDVQTATAKQASSEGFSDTGKARGDLTFVSDWFKKIMTGSDDDLMKLLDIDGLTKSIDENEQQMSEQGVRGGRRAAVLGSAYFDRDALIDKTLKQLRFAAPDKIADIAAQIGQLGLGEIGAGTGAANSAGNMLLSVKEMQQREKDRRAALIGNILGAAGSALGAYFGSKGN